MMEENQQQQQQQQLLYVPLFRTTRMSQY